MSIPMRIYTQQTLAPVIVLSALAAQGSQTDDTTHSSLRRTLTVFPKRIAHIIHQAVVGSALLRGGRWRSHPHLMRVKRTLLRAQELAMPTRSGSCTNDMLRRCIVTSLPDWAIPCSPRMYAAMCSSRCWKGWIAMKIAAGLFCMALPHRLRAHHGHAPSGAPAPFRST